MGRQKKGQSLCNSLQKSGNFERNVHYFSVIFITQLLCNIKLGDIATEQYCVFSGVIAVNSSEQQLIMFKAGTISLLSPKTVGLAMLLYKR